MSKVECRRMGRPVALSELEAEFEKKGLFPAFSRLGCCAENEKLTFLSNNCGADHFKAMRPIQRLWHHFCYAMIIQGPNIRCGDIMMGFSSDVKC